MMLTAILKMAEKKLKKRQKSLKILVKNKM